MKQRRIGQYWEKSGRAYYRVAIADKRPNFMLALAPGPRAEARAAAIEELVRRLRGREVAPDAVAKLVRQAAQAEADEEFANVKLVVDDICGEEFELTAGLTAASTFDELFWSWQKNE